MSHVTANNITVRLIQKQSNWLYRVLSFDSEDVFAEVVEMLVTYNSKFLSDFTLTIRLC